eukprot:scaffold228005_cov22-Tisochrysis_lutea.AAC.1
MSRTPRERPAPPMLATSRWSLPAKMMALRDLDHSPAPGVEHCRGLKSAHALWLSRHPLPRAASGSDASLAIALGVLRRAAAPRLLRTILWLHFIDRPTRTIGLGFSSGCCTSCGGRGEASQRRALERCRAQLRQPQAVPRHLEAQVPEQSRRPSPLARRTQRRAARGTARQCSQSRRRQCQKRPRPKGRSKRSHHFHPRAP